jgi:hypothetical protein
VGQFHHRLTSFDRDGDRPSISNVNVPSRT